MNNPKNQKLQISVGKKYKTNNDSLILNCTSINDEVIYFTSDSGIDFRFNAITLVPITMLGSLLQITGEL